MGERNRSLIPLAGKALVEYPLAALRESGVIGRICLVGPQARLRDAGLGELADVIEQEGADETENLFIGMASIADAELVFLCTSDLALITGEDVRAVVEARPQDAEVCYPLVPAEPAYEVRPNKKWVCARLAEGKFTGSSVALMRPKMVQAQEALVRRIFDARRDLRRLFGLLGSSFMIRAAASYVGIHRLSIRDIERRASEITGLVCRGLAIPRPNLALDVDDPSDYHYAAERLRLPD